MNTKPELLHALDDADRRLISLLQGLDDTQLTVPFEPGINPPIWEIGHCAFFYEYFILRALDQSTPAMPGYDAVWDSFEIKHRERWREGVVPDKNETLDYYHRILAQIRQRIETHNLTPDTLYLYKYAIYHQHMHIESLIWERQTLAYPPPPSFQTTPANPSPIPPLGDANIPAGKYPIGLPTDTPHFATEHFGFDCEKPAFEIELPAFSISKTLVTNRQYLEFIESGNYEKNHVWSHGGKNWLRDTACQHPIYWKKENDGHWQVRLFNQWQPLALDAPVMHVSYWEAEAFAHWLGRRLPTEFEWEAVARNQNNSPDHQDMDATAFAQRPVTHCHSEATSSGCLQMIGTAWEWTTSQFLPYPGFVLDMYPYMSTLQFGDHKVTRGGSCATSSCLIRPTYRQAYHPDRRDVFTSFRTCAL